MRVDVAVRPRARLVVHPPLSEAAWVRGGRRLGALTVGYNLLEAVVSIGARWAAGSTALLGFGVDSLVESGSGVVVLWRLQHPDRHMQREARALQLVGVSLLLLALYVAVEAVRSLVAREAPSPSVVGIALAISSLVVMPWLARQKRRVARALGSGAVQADSRQTSICAYLSAILLAGLGLNALLGWWWADPAAALAMTPLIVREGLEAVQGLTCCDCV